MRALVVAPAFVADARVQALWERGLAADGRYGRAAAEEAVSITGYDAVIVHPDLPDGDGLGLARTVPSRLALIALGVESPPPDDCHPLGARPPRFEDHVSAEVDDDELALRVRTAVLRRTGSPARVRLGRVVVDRLRGEVAVDGQRVPLTLQPMAVLDHLVAHHDRVVSSEELFEHCWDERTDPFADPVYSQVSRLRRAFAGSLRIVRLSRVGYRVEVVDGDGSSG